MANRRKRREKHLLAVKIHTRGRIWRYTRVGTAWLATLAVVALTGYGIYRMMMTAAAKLVLENRRFAVARIEVDNDGVLTSDQIVRLAGVGMGRNLFSLDLGLAQRNLEMIPLVRRVEVRRILPNRLVIRVNERIPVARLQVAGGELNKPVIWIDREGVVIKPLRLADGTVVEPQTPGPLPILTGVPLTEMRVGKRVQSEQIYRAIRLLANLEQSVTGMLLEVEQIDVSKPDQMVVRTRRHTVVRFYEKEFSHQLRRLAVILNWAQHRQKILRTIDLTVNRAVPVTFSK